MIKNSILPKRISGFLDDLRRTNTTPRALPLHHVTVSWSCSSHSCAAPGPAAPGAEFWPKASGPGVTAQAGVEKWTLEDSGELRDIEEEPQGRGGCEQETRTS